MDLGSTFIPNTSYTRPSGDPRRQQEHEKTSQTYRLSLGVQNKTLFD